MKKIVKNLILFLILAMCQSAFCYTLSSDELNKFVFNKINSQTKKMLPNMEYKVNILAAFDDVATQEAKMPTIEISPQDEFKIISYRRVSIKDSKGNVLKSFPVNVKTSIYENVLIATENIPYGKSVDSTNTKIEKREVSKFYDKVIVQTPVDMIASRNILKDNIIQNNLIKPKAIIEKNQNVDIVFQGKGVQIALKGKALKEGAMGEKILVRSDKYNKIYSAIVDSNSKVTVRI